ncbi:F-box domain protein [Drechmeria coniospora]|uniref:F-box domain protein n=1 Tax=Drechmeria coniospora TaxID=98403 RepID=A0A151GPN5_DRECN|nr:F-box domain protein [Drechmeria coniospora]KYK59075.1 F-box domain protein [Drechmeria coniospora]
MHRTLLRRAVTSCVSHSSPRQQHGSHAYKTPQASLGRCSESKRDGGTQHQRTTHHAYLIPSHSSTALHDMPQRLAECLPCTEANPEANPEADGDSGPAPERKPAQVCFLSLPTELHLVIAELLIYPDALSLKHTNRHFYGLVDTGIELKVDWLMERRRMHLECPNDKRCDLGSDLRFCRGSVPYHAPSPVLVVPFRPCMLTAAAC